VTSLPVAARARGGGAGARVAAGGDDGGERQVRVGGRVQRAELPVLRAGAGAGRQPQRRLAVVHAPDPAGARDGAGLDRRRPAPLARPWIQAAPQRPQMVLSAVVAWRCSCPEAHTLPAYSAAREEGGGGGAGFHWKQLLQVLGSRRAYDAALGSVHASSAGRWLSTPAANAAAARPAAPSARPLAGSSLTRLVPAGQGPRSATYARARQSPRGDTLGFAVFSVFLSCSHVVGPQGRHLRRARQAPLLMASLVVIPTASSTSRHV